MEEMKRNPTDEELNQIQSHLSPKDFDEFLKDLAAFHGIPVTQVDQSDAVKQALLDEAKLSQPSQSEGKTCDPRGYSLD